VPSWDPKLGEPYLTGFRVALEANGAGQVSSEFPVSYFKGLASEGSAHFVDKGELKAGEPFRYLAAAFPKQEQTAAVSRPLFVAEDLSPPLPLRDASLGTLSRGTRLHGESHPDDLPAFVPQRVLDEAAALSRGAGVLETGGILIGHLYRDQRVPEIFAEVTAQLPARHTEAQSTRLTFTAATWTDIRAALDLRRTGEIMLGWWHSHPVREWCKDCAVEKQKVCGMASDFFSTHDQALHRTVFPRAYNIALVVNDVGFSQPTFSMFGWRRGMIKSRGFQVRGEE
jgi:proteasome lid subunit RPN8/RPN11